MGEKRDFIPSVCDVYGYDPNSGALLFVGESLTSSMIEVAMSNQEVRGGKNHQLLFDYNFGRTMNFEIASATFKYDFFATNIGKSIVSGTNAVIQKVCVDLDGSGEGTLDPAPSVGTTVNLINLATGAIQEVTPSGATVTYAPWASSTVEALYFADKTVDTLEIDASTTPSVVRLVFVADRFSNSGINGKVSIEIPRAQISGNFSLEFASDNVLSTQLNGKALVESVGCGSSLYGKVMIEPISGSEVPVSQISPYFEDNGSDYIEVAVPVGSPDTYQIKVDGFRSGVYGKTDVTADATFTKATGDTDITVSATGLVSVATTATATDAALIKVEYPGVVDQYVNIVVSA